jgi:thioredoxin reductase/bacterioferritin-associated ferredoxin
MNELPSTPLTVIGAGPAGIMAAYTAADAGMDVTLIDSELQPGGQYYHQSPPEFRFSRAIDSKSGRADAPTVLAKLNHPRIRMLCNTQVWGVFDQHILGLADGEHGFMLATDRVILATGAYDRPLAFPGWTLPGILGAGAAMRMVKTQWVLPGKRILLAGLGPLQLALADTLLKAGAEVVCVAEAANPLKNLEQLPKFFGHWDRLGEAVKYNYSLVMHKVPMLYNHAIVAASGNEQVEKATIARLDDQGAPLPGTEKTYDVDAVCLGYGLLPSFQLAAAFDCRLTYEPNLSWFVPTHDRYLETSQAGIFVAGDVTNIAGSKVALLEGQIAGLSAARQLGVITSVEFDLKTKPLFAKLKKLERLASALQTIYAFRPGLNNLANDETVLCRCEEVTVSQVKEAVANGATDMHQVKLATRTGMGYCQGRFCSVLTAPIIAKQTGKPLDEVMPFTVRPPLQPVSLKILASLDETTPKMMPGDR